MHEKYILGNVNGIAVDDADTRFTAVAVENGRIVGVGTLPDMALFTNTGWPVHDMGGKTLLPGFIDAHQHLGLTGQVLNGLDFSQTTSVEMIVQQVAEAATGLTEGEWLFGFSFNELNLRGHKLPLRSDLDAVCPENPVMVVHSSWHLCVLNSHALRLLELPANLPGMDSDGGGTDRCRSRPRRTVPCLSESEFTGP